MLTELRVLEKCRFPHILALYGVSVDNLSESCIVYEFMSGGSLDDRLKRKVSISYVILPFIMTVTPDEATPKWQGYI